jgi:hypothetical protein
MRARVVVALITAAVLGACAQGRDPLPAACSEPADEWRAALAAASGGDVTLQGATIADCLAPDSSVAELQTVGATFVDVAAGLAPAARRDPRGPEAAQLGYLMGAARAQAARTGGIHDELVRRLEQELHGVDTESQAFAEGERAGTASG